MLSMNGWIEVIKKVALKQWRNLSAQIDQNRTGPLNSHTNAIRAGDMPLAWLSG